MLLAFIPKPPPKSAEHVAAGSADTSAVEANEPVDAGANDTAAEAIAPESTGTHRMSTSLRASTSRRMSHRVSDAPVAVEG